ncbi:MAG: DUF6385 domain-containing protein [Clostridia bacterium]|nr:DUF6385 domain-containing protein [Clostridia bacterium]
MRSNGRDNGRDLWLLPVFVLFSVAVGALICKQCGIPDFHDLCGRLCKKYFGPHFYNVVERDLHTSYKERYSRERDVSHLRMLTYLVINNGSNPVNCQVKMSPDKLVWESLGESKITVAPGKMEAIVPQYFLRYSCIMYRTMIPGEHSRVTIWLQGQS